MSCAPDLAEATTCPVALVTPFDASDTSCIFLLRRSAFTYSIEMEQNKYSIARVLACRVAAAV